MKEIIRYYKKMLVEDYAHREAFVGFCFLKNCFISNFTLLKFKKAKYTPATRLYLQYLRKIQLRVRVVHSFWGFFILKLALRALRSLYKNGIPLKVFFFLVSFSFNVAAAPPDDVLIKFEEEVVEGLSSQEAHYFVQAKFFESCLREGGSLSLEQKRALTQLVTLSSTEEERYKWLQHPMHLIRKDHPSFSCHGEKTLEQEEFRSLKRTIELIQKAQSLFLPTETEHIRLGLLLDYYGISADFYMQATPQEREHFLKDTQRKIIFKGPNAKYRDISTQTVYDIRGTNIYFSRRTSDSQSGTHDVKKLGPIYFKHDTSHVPLRPALERSVYGLYYYLFGENNVLASSTFFSAQNISFRVGADDYSKAKLKEAQQSRDYNSKIQELSLDPDVRFTSEKKSIIFQASRAIEGGHLNENIDREIDRASFSMHVIGSLITNATDCKGDNFKVTTEGKIVGIDNDHVFGVPIEKRGRKHYLKIKNILYFHPLMKEPIEEGVFRHIKEEFSPEECLFRWLSFMEREEGRWKELKPFIHREAFSSVLANSSFEEYQEQSLQLPLYLNEMIVKDVYERLVFLKRSISSGGVLTHSQLFDKLYPIASKVYHKIQKDHSNPVKATDVVYEQAIESAVSIREEIDVGIYEVQQVSLRDALKKFEEKKAHTPKPASDLKKAFLEGFDISRFSTQSLFNFSSYVYEEEQELYQLLFYKITVKDRGGELIDHFMRQYNSGHLTHIPNFIQKGFKGEISEEIGWEFYRKLKHNNQWEESERYFFNHIAKRNSALRFRVYQEEILPPMIGDEGSQFYLEGSQSGNRRIDESLLLFTGENFTHPIEEGRRHVGYLKKGRSSLYFKLLPEFPGKEEQVGTLARMLFGRGVPQTELYRIRGGAYEGYPLLVSEGIEGRTLREVSEEEPEKLRKIDLKQYTELLLLTMLINPEDGNRANYIVSPKIEGPEYEVIAIDNDRSFVPEIARKKEEEGYRVQVKTAVYCFDQMKSPLDSEVLHAFKEINVKDLLHAWIEEMIQRQEGYSRIYASAQELYTYLTQHKSMVEVYYPKGAILTLYSKFLKIQDAIREVFDAGEESITGIELLKEALPHLGRRYERGFTHQIPLGERFHRVEEGQFGKDGEKTLSNTFETLSSQLIPIEEDMFEDLTVQKRSAKEALEDLKKAIELEKEDRIYNENREERERFIRGGIPYRVGQFLRELDFSKLSRGDGQNIFKIVLGRRDLRNVYFKGMHFPSDGNFERYVASFREIDHLDLSNSSGLTYKLIEFLERVHKKIKSKGEDELGLRLSKLNLSRSTDIKNIARKLLWTGYEPISLDMLVDLRLSECPHLKSIQINAPNLESLVVSGNKKLTLVKIEGAKRLKKLVLKRCPCLTKKGIIISPEREEGISFFIDLRENGWFTKSVLDSFLEDYGQLEKMGLLVKELINKGERVFPGQERLSSSFRGEPLRLRSMSFTDLDLKYFCSLLRLSEARNLTQLDLRSNSIGDEGAKALAGVLPQGASALTQLDLSENSIEDEGVRALLKAAKRAFSLEEITINDFRYSSSFLKFIRGDFQHEKLDLRANSIGDEGAKALAEVLPQSRHLTQLDLRSNSIGAEGAKALAKVLPQSRHLTQLDLSDNSIGDKGVRALLKAAKRAFSLEEITINDFRYSSSFLKFIRGDFQHEKLDLRANSIGDEGARALAEVLEQSALTQLDLNSNRIGDEGAKALAEVLPQSRHLTQLDLRANSIGDEGVRALLKAAKRAFSLEEITINDFRYSSSFLKFIRGDFQHEKLDLRANSIGDEGARALAEVLEQSALTQLDLSSNSIGDGGVHALAKVLEQSALTQLDLSSNSIGAEGAKALAKVLEQSALTQLDLSSNSIGDGGVHALAKVLVQSATLTQLYLSDNSIGEEGVRALAEVLEQSALTQLDLSYNSIGAEGAKALAKVLVQKATLTQLYLSENSIGEEGAKALAEVLEQSTLIQLYLGSNKIGDEGAKALAKVLEQSALTQLYLSDNSIEDEGAKALAKVLPQSTLIQLDLGYNSIGAEGAKALAEVLEQSALTQLELSYNSIGDEGAKALAGVLPQSALTQLELSYNSIGDEGAKALAGVLPQSALTQLELSYNSIGDEGARALAAVLPQSGLTQLDLGGNRIGNKLEKEIKKIIETNKPDSGLTIPIIYNDEALVYKGDNNLFSISFKGENIDLLKKEIKKRLNEYKFFFLSNVYLPNYLFITVEDEGVDLKRLLGAKLQSVQRIFYTSDDMVPFIPTGLVYIFFKEGTDEREIKKTLEKYKIKNEGRLEREIFFEAPFGMCPVEISRTIKTENPVVKYCQPDFYTPIKSCSYLPENTQFEKQWHLKNNIDGERSVVGADARVKDAWEYLYDLEIRPPYGNEEIKIAVIDTSFQLDHPSFLGQYVHPYNASNRESEDVMEEITDNPHGTRVAGIISASDEEGPVVGIAPKVKLIPIILSGYTDSDFKRALMWAANHEAKVINISWQRQSSFYVTSEVISALFNKLTRENHISLVFAAGNDRRNIHSDNYRHDFALHPDVITVSASNSRDTLASYANFGEGVSIWAPSGDNDTLGLLTTDIGDNGFINSFKGTSASAPIVSGVIALMLSVNKELTSETIKTLIKSTARVIEGQNGVMGVIDARRAVEAAYASLSEGL